MDIFSDEEMIQRYRFSRAGITEITDIVAPEIEHSTKRNHACRDLTSPLSTKHHAEEQYTGNIQLCFY